MPIPGYHPVVTCFCSHDVVQEKINSSGLKIERCKLHISRDEQGERMEWLFGRIIYSYPPI
jgi:hypothetical protein